MISERNRSHGKESGILSCDKSLEQNFGKQKEAEFAVVILFQADGRAQSVILAALVRFSSRGFIELLFSEKAAAAGDYDPEPELSAQG